MPTPKYIFSASEKKKNKLPYRCRKYKYGKMGIGNVMALAISMMTEEDFWDKFHRKHNPQFYEKLKKKKTQKKKTSRAYTTKRHSIFKV